MGQVTLQDAKEVARKLVADLHPQAVILFGSVAREGHGHDLDLLVIRQEDGKSKKEGYAEVEKLLKEFSERFAIDYFVAVPSVVRELFLKGSPFLRLIQREGRSLYMKDSVKQWMKQAQDDLASAEVLLKAKYYGGTCFHAQQALEKALKGLLIEKHWELEKIHSVGLLATYAEKLGISVPISQEMLTLVDSVYRLRYPGEEGLLPGGDPNEAQATSILSAVQSFFAAHNISNRQ